MEACSTQPNRGEKQGGAVIFFWSKELLAAGFRVVRLSGRENKLGFSLSPSSPPYIARVRNPDRPIGSTARISAR
jgi:hypothetical protein